MRCRARSLAQLETASRKLELLFFPLGSKKQSLGALPP